MWDDSHDTSGDELSGNYSEFNSLVSGAGHTITELNGSPGAIAAALSGIDVLNDSTSGFHQHNFMLVLD